MTMLAATAAGILGLLFGSFANVVIHRVPRRHSLSHPASHCPACSTPIRPRDNVPLVSWLLLGGRCRSCRAPISPRYPLVELSMGVLWALVTARLWAVHPWAVPAYLAFTFICVVLAATDAITKLLPNRITYPAFGAVTVLLAVASIAEHDLARLVRGLEAAGIAGALFFLMALAVPRGFGLGDVKFVPTIAVALGWLAWPAVLLGLFTAFLLGGLVGIAAMVVLHLSRKSLLPFGPWLATAAVLTVLAGEPVVRWYTHVALGA